MKATSSLFTCLQFDRNSDRIQCNPNFFLRRENTRCVTSMWTAAAAFLNPVFTRRWSRWYTVVTAPRKEWRYVFYWERWMIWLTTKSSFSFTYALNRFVSSLFLVSVTHCYDFLVETVLRGRHRDRCQSKGARQVRTPTLSLHYVVREPGDTGRFELRVLIHTKRLAPQRNRAVDPLFPRVGIDVASPLESRKQRQGRCWLRSVLHIFTHGMFTPMYPFWESLTMRFSIIWYCRWYH